MESRRFCIKIKHLQIKFTPIFSNRLTFKSRDAVPNPVRRGHYPLIAAERRNASLRIDSTILLPGRRRAPHQRCNRWHC